MISPYIHFQGNCREAMTEYHRILGGTLQLMPYAEVPDAPPPFRESDRIVHSALMTDSFGNLSASDFPPGMEGDPQQAVTIALETGNLEQGKAIYDALSEGGALIQEWGPSFFSPGFGMFKDRFGTHWMVMVTPSQPA